MNKLKLVLAFLLAQTFALTAYALEFNVGVTGHAGLYAASGNEQIETNGKKSESETAVAEFTYASIFAEAKFDRFVIGGHFIPDTVDTASATENKMTKQNGSATATATTQTIKAEFSNMATAYASVYITDNTYFKVGISSMDLETKESLGTGSSYPDADIDGTEVGFGTNISISDNAFLRLEGVYVEYDGVTLSSTANNNKVTLKGIDGLEGRAALGFTF